jgi:hypothetical protein
MAGQCLSCGTLPKCVAVRKYLTIAATDGDAPAVKEEATRAGIDAGAPIAECRNGSVQPPWRRNVVVESGQASPLEPAHCTGDAQAVESGRKCIEQSNPCREGDVLLDQSGWECDHALCGNRTGMDQR